LHSNSHRRASSSNYNQQSAMMKTDAGTYASIRIFINNFF